jgi:hypothetical protein
VKGGDRRARGAALLAFSRPSLALRVVALVVALLSVLSACGQPAGGEPVAPISSSPPSLSSSPDDAASWPSGSVAVTGVYLLGGSTARECLVSNESWAARMRALGVPAASAVDMGGTNQTFTLDRRLVAALPRGSVVLIGVSLGRFTRAPSLSLETKPLTAEERAMLAGESEIRHRYRAGSILSDERKQELLERWLDERYPHYRRNFDGNLAELGRLLDDCSRRDLRPALVELPLDLEAAGDELAVPRRMYLDGCSKIASSNGVPFLSFVDELKLSTDEFYDLMHLVEPGREKWQERLSNEVAGLLAAY